MKHLAAAAPAEDHNESTASHTRQEHVAVFLFSFFVIMLVNLKLKHFDRAAIGTNYLRFVPYLYDVTKFTPFLQAFCLYRLILHLRERVTRWPLIYILPAAFFSIWMIEGLYFERSHAVDFFDIEKFFVLMSILAALGYFVIYYLTFVMLDVWFERIAHAVCDRSDRFDGTRLAKWLEARPFLVSLLLMTPFVIGINFIAYPGLFQGDAKEQVLQALHIRPLYYKHPIIHTMLIRLGLYLGNTYFGSENVGIYFTIFLQSVALTLAFAYCVHTLVRSIGLRGYAALLVPLVFIIHPRCFQYFVQLTKDTIFCAFLICFLCSTLRMLWGKGSRHEEIPWALFAIGTILFRRDGFYFIVPSLVFMMIIKRTRIKSFIVLVTVLVTFTAWNRVAMPLMNVQPASQRVIYSLVFQGTARYLTEFPEDVTPEEHDAIDAVLEYDALVRKYVPERADKVIRTYRDDSTKEEMVAYLKATLGMFRRHPSSFMRAIFNNKYHHFYPSYLLVRGYMLSFNLESMDAVNKLTGGITNFKMPELQYRLYGYFEAAREAFWHLPGMSQLMSSLAVMYSAAFLMCYSLRKRYRKALDVMSVMATQILIAFAGPTNGLYFRYTFPIVVVLTISFLLVCKSAVDAPLYAQGQANEPGALPEEHAA